MPTEHLASDGIDGDFARGLAARPSWSEAHVKMLEQGVALYWTRYDELSARAPYLSPPRLRSLGIVLDGAAIRPYAQILNESVCKLYLDDLNPDRGHPEFVAYALALEERAAETGELLRAAVHLAPWWFERSDEECAAFAHAADGSQRPDALLYRAIAGALPWLREVRHKTLRPARKGAPYREIPGTGLLIPRAYESAPDALIGQVQAAATDTLRAFHAQHRPPADAALDGLEKWLRDERPDLLVTDEKRVIVWESDRAADTGALRRRLERAGPEVVSHLRGDLECIAEHSRRFTASVRTPNELPRPDADAALGGYTFLHHERGLIAYNLDEPGIERLLSPGIPYARAMLGARTLHEWAHLAVDAGWVPRSVDSAGWLALRNRLVARRTQTIDELPKPVRRIVAPDLAELGQYRPPAESLADIFERRLPDFQANLLATRHQSDVEREAYVRQNIRPLRSEFPAAQVLRMLVRYVYELQYLGFSQMEDPRTYFYEMTWFEADFFDTGILDESALDELSAAAAALCLAHQVDDSRFVRTT